MDLGILPGTVIRAEMRSPGGDPTAYRIRGALIALRADPATAGLPIIILSSAWRELKPQAEHAPQAGR